MKLYALRNKKTGNFYGITATSNGEAQFCNEVTIRLQEVSRYFIQNIWTTANKEDAEKIISDNPEWYNSDIDHPCWPEHNKNEFVKSVEIVEFATVESPRV